MAARDVGYAGRKDRMAVTTQWLSVPGLDPDRALELELRGARVLEAHRHRHKLRTGQLRGNAFRLVLRGLSEAERAGARRRWSELLEQGLPNAFGAQRFGRAGDNAQRARELLSGAAPVRDRRAARFLLSALQAEVFNAVLAARETPLDALERGDVAVLHASGGLFVVEDPERESARARRFELSPTGPIFGTGSRDPRPEHAVADRERRELERAGIPAELQPPPGLRMRGGRRALRVPVEDPRFEDDAGAVVLGFRLPPGSYATVLFERLFG